MISQEILTPVLSAGATVMAGAAVNYIRKVRRETPEHFRHFEGKLDSFESSFENKLANMGDQIERRLDSMESRLSHLEGRVDNLNGHSRAKKRRRF